MALTRKFLTALGIESEKIEEIINAHLETVNALKEERDGFKADAEKLADVQKELDAAKENAKNNDAEKYKSQYADLKKQFDDFKAETKAKQLKQDKIAAYKALLKDAGVSEKRIAAVVKVSDIDALELDDDGKIKDAGAKKDAIKKEWADFIVTEEKRGAEEKTPPQGEGSGNGTSRAAMVAQKHYAEIYGEKGVEKK